MKSVQGAYSNYLELMKLDLSKMPKDQQQETKRAFYGGFGSCLTIIAPIFDKGSQVGELNQEIMDYYNSQSELDKTPQKALDKMFELYEDETIMPYGKYKDQYTLEQIPESYFRQLHYNNIVWFRELTPRAIDRLKTAGNYYSLQRYKVMLYIIDNFENL